MRTQCGRLAFQREGGEALDCEDWTVEFSDRCVMTIECGGVIAYEMTQDE